jgi:2-oxoglutarate ferredoxin oxidoreductase subunit beta
MPALATGVMLANQHLLAVGVSGDGDTASIGMGQFVHLLRRNVPMMYIVENNGVYGLTKGQFSATADFGSKAKGGYVNDLPAIDICAMAIELGLQLRLPIVCRRSEAARRIDQGRLGHKGTTLFDVISPCVTFNNHEGSTKSYKYAKDHEELLHEISYVPFFEQISVDYKEGEAQDVTMHDGSQSGCEKRHTNMTRPARHKR